MTLIGVDLFAGAGGLSLGAEMAGISVKIAIENDIYAAQTYQANHPNTKVVVKSIQEVDQIPINADGTRLVLFGGPPCQGFSTSNQKNRNKSNPKNWLFEEFIRVAKLLQPEWIVFENVRGIVETEHGFFAKLVCDEIRAMGYTCSSMILCAADYGVPQTRSRFFLIGSHSGLSISRPQPSRTLITVKDAIFDLPSLDNGASIDIMEYKTDVVSDYAETLRHGLAKCSGHLVTKNSKKVLQRYAYIPEGGNWKDIPDSLMDNYKDKSRCHTGIYKRLSSNMPAVTVGNYRKSMLIHPWENRGLSVREAARLQSFPDSYVFCGSLGFQQQQIGNAVPPNLARAVFQSIVDEERRKI